MAGRFCDRHCRVGAGRAERGGARRQGGQTHILLERTRHVNDTIFKYQKRKHVMATPEFLPLRSDLGFKESSREEVIETWTGGVEGAEGQRPPQRRGHRRSRASAAISSSASPAAKPSPPSMSSCRSACRAICASLTIPGAAEATFVQYQLDDPDEYHGEEIIVIGTGDAGIENALALSANNNVTIINRVADYPYAKPANAALIQGAINKGDITAFVNSEPKGVEPGILVLDTRTARRASNATASSPASAPCRRASSSNPAASISRATARPPIRRCRRPTSSRCRASISSARWRAIR